MKPQWGGPNFQVLGQALERRGIAISARFRLASFSGETFGLQAAPFGRADGCGNSARPSVATGQASSGERVASVKVISWNLLRRTGAAVADLVALIEREEPDLLLLQEATTEIEALPSIAGGHLQRLPLPGRIYGLGVWSPEPLSEARPLALPSSQLPGRVPPRLAQLVEHDGIAFANVHLSHGQVLNRRQLYRIARTLVGPAAIVGDYNAVGPTVLPGFRDVGPRQATHRASEVVPFRLDRCLVRGLRCTEVDVLDRGPSDHHPILLQLEALPTELEAPMETLMGGAAPTALPRPSWVRLRRRAGGRSLFGRELREP